MTVALTGVAIEWVAAGSIIVGTIFAGLISSFSAVWVARIQGKDAMAREERMYRRQDEVAARLVASNQRTEDLAKETARRAAETAHTVDAVADNISKIELATNSMKDALITAAGAAGEQRGRDNEIARVKAESDKT